MAAIADPITTVYNLFNITLDLVSRFKAYRDYDDETYSVDAVFASDVHRFEQWGQATGFKSDGLREDHHKALDNPETCKVVTDIFLATERKIDSYSTKPASRAQRRSAAPSSGFRSKIKDLTSAKAKLQWVILDKDDWSKDVRDFGILIEQLYRLAPLDQLEGHALTDVKSVVVRIEEEQQRRQKQNDHERHRKIFLWILGGQSPSHKYETVIKARLENTCAWILADPEFCRWASADIADRPEILWIHAPGGHGKSVMCGKIIEHLSLRETPVAHFFIDDSSQGDPYGALRFWLSQIMPLSIPHSPALKTARETVLELAGEIYDAQMAQHATRAELLTILTKAAQAIPGCTFVVDGLDECIYIKEDVSNQSSAVGFINDVKQAVDGSHTRILIVSRHNPDIRECLESGKFYERHITFEDVQPDITLLVDDTVERKLGRSRTNDPKLQSLSRAMVDFSDGLFLRVKLQERYLNRYSSLKKLERVIEQTPKGLEKIYQREWNMIDGLDDSDRDEAISLLRWTAFARRPLKVSEVIEAVTLREDYDDFPFDELPSDTDEYVESFISGRCGALLDVRSLEAPELESGEVESGDLESRELVLRESGSHGSESQELESREPKSRLLGSQERTVHLHHFAVKECLLRELPHEGSSQSNPSEALAAHHRILAKMCLRYIGFPSVWNSECSLRDYAAGSWAHHFALSKPDDEVIGLINHLFDGPTWQAWRSWFNSHEPPSTNSLGDATSSPLLYASQLGLTETVLYLLETCGYDVNTALMPSQDPDESLSATPLDVTPLHVASANGHVEVVEMLIQKKADISALSFRSCTALHFAAAEGHVEVVKSLIAAGIDMNHATKYGFTALIYATAGGFLPVMKLLVSAGADANISSATGATIVHAAASSGNPEVMTWILDHTAKICVVGDDRNTPLHFAAKRGHLSVVSLLLARDATIDAIGLENCTPLFNAAANGHAEIVRVLLEHKADPNILTDDGWSPLNVAAAASYGYPEIVTTLLEHDAAIDQPNNKGSTPLYSAAILGHIEVVKVLLQHHAAIDQPDSLGYTPLKCAAASGHVEIVKVLLEHHAAIDQPDTKGWTPLSSAAASGHVEIVKVLLEHHAAIDQPDSYGRTPLNSAAASGHVEVVKVLLQHHAAIDQPDIYARTPLSSAAASGHVEIVKVLLQHRAATDQPDSKGWTALKSATAKGHVEIVKALLEHDATACGCKERPSYCG